MEEIEQLWQKYQAAKQRAEQHMFVIIALFDGTIAGQYDDLKENYSDDKKELFKKNINFMLSKIT